MNNTTFSVSNFHDEKIIDHKKNRNVNLNLNSTIKNNTDQLRILQSKESSVDGDGNSAQNEHQLKALRSAVLSPENQENNIKRHYQNKLIKVGVLIGLMVIIFFVVGCYLIS